ncbi:hypothetical protein [Emticicia sp. C21]|uniref:hypothetical protein n=1 Tax=Emticicia sp. C21 TaxID=2302915 RepID=UPI000E342D0C|nr:hypothetical protein [Emticicia sp. C21]RFS18413.1 hypothetical protein D0T08_03955 [Emticicia sp. C21]
MKKLFLLIVTVLITSATYAKEDSLIARIGKKAKIVFYADKPEDFKEIGKYDLNLLFKELKKRSEKNFSLSEDVTLKEADEFKNRDANTAVKPKRWFNKMNLNLFIGANQAFITNTWVRSGVGTPYYDSHFAGNNYKASDNTLKKDFFRIEGERAVMVGIGGFFDKTLAVKGRTAISLRYGAGFDLLGSKLRIKRVSSMLLDPKTEKEEPTYYEAKEYPTAKVNSANLYLQALLGITFINRKGERTFNFGVGVKMAAGLNSMNNKIATNGKFLYLEHGAPVPIKYRTLQTGFIANVGYKFINLFFQMMPNNIVITSAQTNIYSLLIVRAKSVLLLIP